MSSVPWSRHRWPFRAEITSTHLPCAGSWLSRVWPTRDQHAEDAFAPLRWHEVGISYFQAELQPVRPIPERHVTIQKEEIPRLKKVACAARYHFFPDHGCHRYREVCRHAVYPASNCVTIIRPSQEKDISSSSHREVRVRGAQSVRCRNLDRTPSATYFVIDLRRYQEH